MSRLRLAVLLLLCVLASMPGWAMAHARHGGSHAATGSSFASWSGQVRISHPVMVAVVDETDCDADCYGCDDPHCKHGCSTGCNMATCAGPGAALLRAALTFSCPPSVGALDALVAPPPPLARASSPLRPPIA